MTAEPLAVIDTETAAEIVPPCDANEDCNYPAAWVIRMSCGCIFLNCTEHMAAVHRLLGMAAALGVRLGCLRCKTPDPTVLSVETL